MDILLKNHKTKSVFPVQYVKCQRFQMRRCLFVSVQIFVLLLSYKKQKFVQALILNLSMENPTKVSYKIVKKPF